MCSSDLCGMTTAWAHLVRGQWLAACRANVGGVLLGLLAMVGAPWLLGSACQGRWWGWTPTERALLAGILTGVMGGMLGSFTILRQLSFFSDALGHAALLGISIGILLGLNPSVVVLPFAVLFALGVSYLLDRTHLWTDALLNIIYSSSLAVSIIMLSFVGQYKGGLNSLLFGDILAVGNLDLVASGLLLLVCTLFIGLTLRTQILLTLHEDRKSTRLNSSHRT